jgi:hypothetical protein
LHYSTSTLDLEFGHFSTAQNTEFFSVIFCTRIEGINLHLKCFIFRFCFDAVFSFKKELHGGPSSKLTHSALSPCKLQVATVRGLAQPRAGWRRRVLRDSTRGRGQDRWRCKWLRRSEVFHVVKELVGFVLYMHHQIPS